MWNIFKIFIMNIGASLDALCRDRADEISRDPRTKSLGVVNQIQHTLTLFRCYRISA